MERKLANSYALTAKPYLVQRVKWNSTPRQFEGVDRYFRFDYMGSSEFEFGSLPSALKFMREDVGLWPTKPVKISAGKHNAWYVGPPECLEYVQQFFATQLNPKRSRGGLKERTLIEESYTNKEHLPMYEGVIGWWAIDAAPCPWIFFKEKNYAEKWLECIKKSKGD